MSLIGFNASNAAPVYLTLVPGTLATRYTANPILIDWQLATWSNGGLIVDIPSATPATVGPMRHWIPIEAIAEITQKQPDPIPDAL